MMYDAVMVMTAWLGLGRTSATTPPEAAATMGATIGSSQAAVMLSREALCWVVLLSLAGNILESRKENVQQERHV